MGSHARSTLQQCPGLVEALVALSLLGTAAAAAADDPSAWRRCDGWEIAAYAVRGVPDGLAGDLTSGLELAGRPRLLRGFERPPFSAAALAADIRRIQIFLAARGYPGADVRVDLAPDEHARQVRLTLTVVPGEAVTIAEVRLSGWPGQVPPPPAADPQLPRAGERFTDARIEDALVHLAAVLQEAGYATVTVERRLQRVGAASVAVEFAVTPGDPYTITAVSVEGCADDLRPLARRVLDIEPPTEFSRSRLENAALDLRTTQLFGRVDLATEPTAPGELALAARLTDARMRAFSASVGTWSDNPWVLQAGWAHRNLFRGGRGLRIGGVYATHDQRLGAEVFKLGWLSPRAVTSLGGEWVREDEDAYLSNEYIARLLQSFRPRGRGLWQVGVSVSNVDVVSYSPDAEDLPESQEWLLEFYVDRKWDWTDDLIYPTRGGYAKLALTWAPAAAFFGASYVQTQADAAGYLGLGAVGRGAARLRLGWSRPLGDNPDLLANRRFYAGGYNTMRGYERRRLGPRDAENNPRGGQATVLAGVELRRHLAWILDCAFFLDAGDVWRTPEEAALRWLRSAWGADLDIRTPLGPLRVGYAWNIGPVLPGEPSELWHFGIGYPW